MSLLTTFQGKAQRHLLRVAIDYATSAHRCPAHVPGAIEGMAHIIHQITGGDEECIGLAIQAGVRGVAEGAAAQRTFQVGDEVTLTMRRSGYPSYVPMGTKGTIKQLSLLDAKNVLAITWDGEVYDSPCIGYEQVTLVPKTEEPTLKVGDKVKLVCKNDHYPGGVKIDSIGTVSGSDTLRGKETVVVDWNNGNKSRFIDKTQLEKLDTLVGLKVRDRVVLIKRGQDNYPSDVHTGCEGVILGISRASTDYAEEIVIKWEDTGKISKYLLSNQLRKIS